MDMIDNHRHRHCPILQWKKKPNSRMIWTKAQAQKHLSLQTKKNILSIFGCFFIHRSSFSLSSIPFNRLLSTQSKSIKSEWSDMLLSLCYFRWKKSTPHRIPSSSNTILKSKVFYVRSFFSSSSHWRSFGELLMGMKLTSFVRRKNKWVAICSIVELKLWQAKQLEEINARHRNKKKLFHF